MKKSLLTAVFSAAAIISGTSYAADFPSKPIRVIVPFAPGGSTDIVTRIVTAKMSDILGKPMVVENKAGAGGAIGASEAARAKPDGYTLSIATVSTLGVNPACKPEGLGYDPLKDFAPVSNFVNVPNVLEVNPKFPANDFQSFLAEVKANPNKYSYGSSGTCSVLHLFGEAFRLATDTDIVHVPYRGSGPAVTDAVGGQIGILFDNLPSSFPQIEAKNLRPLAIAWEERLDSMKDVPTFKELGYPELNQPVWYGLLAPAGTPEDVIATLNKATLDALKDPTVIAALEKQGAFPAGNSPEEFAKEIQQQYDWAKDVVKKGNIELQ
ncbi:tripartite tricarboxylate transporter substrate binding protein BugE [Advenella alkanexedens]|jgi:tripartite-type tricarboxylate transporter receptor subunit TctC|uniref:Tripartite tricarboxylate transporter substrate binding protein BugE n=1 Tax=Advenella alkanexedens TaxID=1481665 RepID=A0ABS6NL76_9BURK|nr:MULTISPECIES: tripartite tricarboxylate transporter substrate binding protein BugE [Advenella]MBV4396124.1 tripartite tricarboxylate transporter substrate binding protein BugE [Advenella alkanexedens]MDD3757928.1 tripartite tricarboxylate transporter substrate binding protein BugE [Advenella sp.]NLN68838.1 tripartite tricarboxylate transporter substrate binding protein BugE [Alcaligenaceae bacterium]